ncbi:MAG: hypothetical protein ACW99G_21075 [Candidatus Thorarchaeota archaeon]|jgi:hypothetical protein
MSLFDTAIQDMVRREVKKQQSGSDRVFSRANHKWERDEEEFLIREVRQAIDEIAIRHRRSFNSIKERLSLLIKGDKLCGLRGLPTVRSERYKRRGGVL